MLNVVCQCDALASQCVRDAVSLAVTLYVALAVAVRDAVSLAVTLDVALAVAVRDAVSQAVALFVALAAAVNDMNTVCKLQQLCIDGRQRLAQTFDVTLFSLQWEHRPFSNPWLSAPANAMQPHYTLGLRARRRAVRA